MFSRLRTAFEDLNRFAALLDARHDPNLIERHRAFDDETHASIFPAVGGD